MFERSHIEKRIPPLIGWINRYRIAVLVTCAALFALGGWGMQHVKFDPDVLVYFDRSMEERQALETIEARFGRTNEIVYVLRGKDGGSMLEAPHIEAISWLQSRAGGLPDASANRSVLDLAGTPLDGEETNAADILRRAIADAGFSARSVISEDETVAAVAVVYPRSSQGDIDLEAVTSAAQALQEEFRDRYPQTEALMTGRLMMDRAFVLEGQEETYGYAGIQAAVLAVILLITFRSMLATFALISVIVISGPLTMSAVAAMGFPLNGISSAASTVLLGLAVATGVHIMLAWQRALNEGLGRQDAVVHAMTINAAPVALSVATTIISFLCLNLAASPPFGQLGSVVSLGLVIVFILCFTLLPAMLLTIPARKRNASPGLAPVMRRLGCFVVRRNKPLFALFAATAVFSIAGIAQIVFDDRFSHYFDERFEVRRATDLFEEKLTGTTFIDFSVPVAAEGGPFSADHLVKLQKFSAWLATQPAYADDNSLKNVLARIAARSPRLLDANGLPASEAADRALRGAYEQMRADGLIGLIDAEGRYSRISVVLRGVSSSEILDFAEKAKNQAARIFGGPVIATGLPILSAQLSIDSTHTMLISMIVALTGVSVLMLLALQNVRLGLISLLPNVLPAVVAMGLWGFAVGEVSFAATVVGALTFGIVVDDSVHMLMKYQAARQRGLGPQLAIHDTMRSVGLAVVVTTIALALSFAVFTFSGFLVNQHLGWLTALTLVAALIADLFFLPPLLLHAEKPRRKDGAIPQPATASAGD